MNRFFKKLGGIRSFILLVIICLASTIIAAILCLGEDEPISVSSPSDIESDVLHAGPTSEKEDEEVFTKNDDIISQQPRDNCDFKESLSRNIQIFIVNNSGVPVSEAEIIWYFGDQLYDNHLDMFKGISNAEGVFLIPLGTNEPVDPNVYVINPKNRDNFLYKKIIHDPIDPNKRTTFVLDSVDSTPVYSIQGSIKCKGKPCANVSVNLKSSKRFKNNSKKYYDYQGFIDRAVFTDSQGFFQFNAPVSLEYIILLKIDKCPFQYYIRHFYLKKDITSYFEIEIPDGNIEITAIPPSVLNAPEVPLSLPLEIMYSGEGIMPLNYEVGSETRQARLGWIVMKNCFNIDFDGGMKFRFLPAPAEYIFEIGDANSYIGIETVFLTLENNSVQKAIYLEKAWPINLTFSEAILNILRKWELPNGIPLEGALLRVERKDGNCDYVREIRVGESMNTEEVSFPITSGRFCIYLLALMDRYATEPIWINIGITEISADQGKPREINLEPAIEFLSFDEGDFGVCNKATINSWCENMSESVKCMVESGKSVDSLTISNEMLSILNVLSPNLKYHFAEYWKTSDPICSRYYEQKLRPILGE